MATRIKREMISAVNTAWLRMDRPQNLMTVCGVLIFGERVDYARLKAVVARRFLRFPRFRQRAVEATGEAYWEPDPHFEITRHVVRAALPGGAGTRELEAQVSRLASTPLDSGRPAWRFDLVENFRGGSALILRIHHSYAKGAAIWADPVQRATLAEQAQALAGEIAGLVLMRQDSPTRFKGKPGIDKRVAWSATLPLAEVKAVAKALGASVNDLPLGIVIPVERLYAVRGNMNTLKHGYQPVLSLGILAAAGLGPRMVQETLLALLARNGTAVMTNVPGPAEPLYLAGRRIDSVLFWVPQSGDIGLGVSIMSYNGAVQFGVITDRGLCPDPENVVTRFVGEFEKLVLTTLMAPWPREGDLSPEAAAAAVGAARCHRYSLPSRSISARVDPTVNGAISAST